MWSTCPAIQPAERGNPNVTLTTRPERAAGGVDRPARGNTCRMSTTNLLPPVADVALKSIREPRCADDGHRVLISASWPIGPYMRWFQVDDWARAVLPSHRLRRWFINNPDAVDEFREQYLSELREAPHHVAVLRNKADRHRLTFVVDETLCDLECANVLTAVLERASRG